jgi:transcriptional repressor NrdR
MRCPHCSHTESKVTDSREAQEIIRRRRECLSCSIRFTTFERIQTTNLLIIKHDGRREAFNRDKLLSGILKACTKRPISIEVVDKAVDDIDTALHHLGHAEVPSAILGEMVMRHLRGIDRVAYIRFASVYRQFQNAESFMREIEALIAGREMLSSHSQLPLPSDISAPKVQKRKNQQTKIQPMLNLDNGKPSSP